MLREWTNLNSVRRFARADRLSISSARRSQWMPLLNDCCRSFGSSAAHAIEKHCSASKRYFIATSRISRIPTPAPKDCLDDVIKQLAQTTLPPGHHFVRNCGQLALAPHRPGRGFLLNERPRRLILLRGWSSEALTALRVKSITLEGEGVVCGPDGCSLLGPTRTTRFCPAHGVGRGWTPKPIGCSTWASSEAGVRPW
jgi:hypothetical protein